MGARAKKKSLSTEDVLNRGAEATAADLIRLIREENPTGRALPRAVETERYRRKSALQSELIERYAEELAIVRDDPDSDVVSIRHVMLGLDACHALLGELTSDARSITLRMLDLADAASCGLPPPAPASGCGVMRPRNGTSLADGDACLLEYDFEGARESYTAVWDATSSLDAMVRLLRLLVDHLGADEEATALASSLPTTIARSAEVRAMVALAFARQGKSCHAERWLLGAEEHRAADVMAILARTALRDGDLETASRLAQRAKLADPGAQKVVEACKEVQLEEDAEMARQESSLEELVARKAGAAERAARQILARFERSRVARRVLGELEAVRQVQASRAALERVARLVEEGERRAALDLVSQIEMKTLSANERVEATELRLRLRRELEAEERSARIAAAIDSVTSAPWSLERYLRLSDEEREVVRTTLSSEPLQLAEDVSSTVTGLPAGEVAAVVDAVVAARSASSAEEALRRMDLHRAVLLQVAGVRAWLLALQQRHETALRRAQREQVRRLLDAHRRGDIETAVQLVPQVQRAHLSGSERDAFDAVVADIREDRNDARHLQYFLNHCRRGDVDALRAARQRIEAGPPAFRSRWSAAVDRGRELIEAELQTQNVAGDDDMPVGGRLVAVTPRGLVLSRAHDAIVAAEVVGAQLCVRLLDARSGALRRTMVLTLGRDARAAAVSVVDDMARIVVDTGEMLELGLPELQLAGRANLRSRVDFDVVDADLSCNGRFVWVRGSKGQERMIRARDRCAMRSPSPRSTAQRARAGVYPITALPRDRKPEPGATLADCLASRLAALHPTGPAVVTFARQPLSESMSVGILQILYSDAPEPREIVLRDMPDSIPVLLTSLNERIIVAQSQTGKDNVIVAVTDDDGEGLRQIWSLQVPRDVCVVADESFSEVYAFDRSRERIVARLTRQFPGDLGRWHAPPLNLRLKALVACPCAIGHDTSDVKKLVAASRNENRPVTVEMALRVLGDGDRVRTFLVGFFASCVRGTVDERFLNELCKEQDARRTLFFAERSIEQGDWDHASYWLDQLATNTLTDEQRAHEQHLRAVVAFAVNDVTSLERAVRELEDDAGWCDLAKCRLLVALASEQTSSEAPDVAAARDVIARYFRADGWARSGDFLQALRELDDPQLWVDCEPQVTVRRAAAALQWRPETALGHVERRLLLARCAAGLAERGAFGHSIALPGAVIGNDEGAARGLEAKRALERELTALRHRLSATEAGLAPAEARTPCGPGSATHADFGAL